MAITLKDGLYVRIGARKPEIQLPAAFNSLALTPGMATIADIIPPGEPFPPMKMWRYYKIEPHEERYSKIQEAKPYERVVLRLDARKAVKRKRFGKEVDAKQTMYTVLPRLVFDAFCTIPDDQS